MPIIKESMDATPADTRKEIIIISFLIRVETGVVDPIIGRYTSNNSAIHMQNAAEKKY
jgi:hypothetical protein